MTTISTPEHLNLIKQFCERNLALAEKRTPGKWTAESKDTNGNDYDYPIRVTNAEGESVAIHSTRSCFLKEGDAYFIAACASAAEAGWRATIAAIDAFLALGDHYLSYCHIYEIVEPILTAYPLELLQ